jgi:hypothetical protein
VTYEHAVQYIRRVTGKGFLLFFLERGLALCGGTLRSAGASCALRGHPALCGGHPDPIRGLRDRPIGPDKRDDRPRSLRVATFDLGRGSSGGSRHIFEHADLLPSSEVNPRHQRPTPAHVRFMPLCRICCGLLGRDGATRAVRKGAGHDRGPPLPLWREFCPTMMGRQLSHGSGGSDLRTCVRDGASGLP